MKEEVAALPGVLDKTPSIAGARVAVTGAAVCKIPRLAYLNTDALRPIVSYLYSADKVHLAGITTSMSLELKKDVERAKLLHKFLHHVAYGQQDEAERMLLKDPGLLTQHDVFADCSGLKFDCTAYEYAYWAKDTHMLHMLEKYMDEKAKAILQQCIEMMEEVDCITGQARGLRYWKGGVEHRSSHFNLDPFKAALQYYVDGYADWVATRNWDAMKSAWLEIGKKQRDFPAHVAQEYCRPDRSFQPIPTFREKVLPRELLFYGYNMSQPCSWFSAIVSPTSGLGFDFSLIRAGWLGPSGQLAGAGSPLGLARCDLAAVTHLDEVRIAQLADSRAFLNAPSAVCLMTR